MKLSIAATLTLADLVAIWMAADLADLNVTAPYESAWEDSIRCNEVLRAARGSEVK